MVWRGAQDDPAPPDPWPSRVDAFLTACAMHAGERERDLVNIITGLGAALEKK